ncbi:cyclic nucleotide-binding domain-containing protein [Bacteriovoracales bacterium]|nr:cyclic nucleotide-binding domain-containing protein [Bacteriovoracales bacterium]
MSEETIHLKKNDIIFSEGENDHNLYLISSGKVMAFLTHRTEVTPVAYFKRGDFIGELAFFDKSPRSASLVCLEETILKKYNYQQSKSQFPDWSITLAESITKKFSDFDELIKNHGIRRKKTESIKPLSIEEQRYYYGLLKEYKGKAL